MHEEESVLCGFNNKLFVGSVHQSSIYIPSKGKITTTSSKRTKTFQADKHVVLPLAIATNTVAMATTKFLPIL